MICEHNNMSSHRDFETGSPEKNTTEEHEEILSATPTWDTSAPETGLFSLLPPAMRPARDFMGQSRNRSLQEHNSASLLRWNDDSSSLRTDQVMVSSVAAERQNQRFRQLQKIDSVFNAMPRLNQRESILPNYIKSPEEMAQFSRPRALSSSDLLDTRRKRKSMDDHELTSTSSSSSSSRSMTMSPRKSSRTGGFMEGISSVTSPSPSGHAEDGSDYSDAVQRSPSQSPASPQNHMMLWDCKVELLNEIVADYDSKNSPQLEGRRPRGCWPIVAKEFNRRNNSDFPCITLKRRYFYEQRRRSRMASNEFCSSPSSSSTPMSPAVRSYSGAGNDVDEDEEDFMDHKEVTAALNDTSFLEYLPVGVLSGDFWSAHMVTLFRIVRTLDRYYENRRTGSRRRGFWQAVCVLFGMRAGVRVPFKLLKRKYTYESKKEKAESTPSPLAVTPLSASSRI